MTLDKFISKYDGKFIDFDKKYGGQCVDLYRSYCQEVLAVDQSPPVEGAYQIWDTCDPKTFEKVENTLKGIPLRGDILIWEKSFGGYGHVAVFVEGDDKKFKSFDQNFPLKSPCHIQGHDYKKLIGWLRCKIKKEDMTNDQKNILKFIEEQKADEGKVRQAFGALADLEIKEKQIQTLQARVLDLEKNLKDLTDRITALESDINANLGLIESWQSKVESANKKLEKIEKELVEQAIEKNQWKNRYEAKCQETVDKYSNTELLKELLIRLKLWPKN
jgi:hypothetical protein